ncbi:hypothetical protein I546_2186 [Mycobacterium kansasii 732]|nr:hypothetical protein I546_2186 [Mycobacterium kansasii 732]
MQTAQRFSLIRHVGRFGSPALRRQPIHRPAKAEHVELIMGGGGYGIKGIASWCPEVWPGPAWVWTNPWLGRTGPRWARRR